VVFSRGNRVLVSIVHVGNRGSYASWSCYVVDLV
jgi:hypothetical protein